MTEITVYAPTAYQPARIPQQPPMPTGKPKGMEPTVYATADRLPWGHTQDVIPMSLIDGADPKSLAKIAKEIEKKGNLTERAYDSAMNHICIRPASLSKGSSFLYLSTYLCLGMAYMCSFFYICTFTAMYFGLALTPLEIINETILAIFWFIIFPYFYSVIGRFLINRDGLKQGKGAKWEFNRQTGMVTIYKDEQGQRVAYERPFYEFDAYLTRNPSPNGIIYYNLRIQHRYEDLAIKAFLDTSTGSREPAWAAWDFIQNYMDITHPLPEVGVFEFCRPYDPTTIAYDQKTGRNPRFRRDMTMEEWYDYEKKLLEDIYKVSPQHPNIMAQYVDYNSLNP